MKKLCLILVLLLTSKCSCADEWTQADTVREGVYVTLHTIDWLQTRTRAKYGWEGHYEAGLLHTSEHPTPGQLDAHYAITTLGHYFVARALPSEWRHAWQYIAIGDAGSAVIVSYRIGLRIKF